MQGHGEDAGTSSAPRAHSPGGETDGRAARRRRGRRFQQVAVSFAGVTSSGCQQSCPLVGRQTFHDHIAVQRQHLQTHVPSGAGLEDKSRCLGQRIIPVPPAGPRTSDQRGRSGHTFVVTCPRDGGLSRQWDRPPGSSAHTGALHHIPGAGKSSPSPRELGRSCFLINPRRCASPGRC